MRFLVQYLFLRTTLFILCRLPYSWTMVFAVFIGRLIFVLGIRRRVLMGNLKACFPELSEDERRRMARESCVHFAKTVVEMGRFPVITDEYLRENVKIEGKEEFEALLKESGKGLLAVVGHLGNYEVGPLSARMYGYAFNGIYQPLRNPRINDYLLRMRQWRGQQLISWKRALREGIEALKRNEILAILPDQDAGIRGLFVPFFGISASTKIGPGKIAFRTGCPVVTLFVHREPDNTYVIHLGGPIQYDKADGEEAVTLKITTEFMRRLEEMVKRYPEQYFWLHKRFKTRPPNEIPRRNIYA